MYYTCIGTSPHKLINTVEKQITKLETNNGPADEIAALKEILKYANSKTPQNAKIVLAKPENAYNTAIKALEKEVDDLPKTGRTEAQKYQADVLKEIFYKEKNCIVSSDLTKKFENFKQAKKQKERPNKNFSQTAFFAFFYTSARQYVVELYCSQILLGIRENRIIITVHTHTVGIGANLFSFHKLSAACIFI